VLGKQGNGDGQGSDELSGMRVDPDGKALQGVSTFLTFIVLNVLFLVTCIPVVTIGVATSALFEVTIRYSNDERGHLIKDYFIALRRNALRATVVSLTLLVPLVALAFSGVFWLLQNSVVSGAVAIVAFLGALYLFAAFLFGMAIVANFHEPIRRSVKNALLLPAAEPWRTLVLILMPGTVLSLTIIFPYFTVILLTIGFSVGAYASAFIFRSAFARH
jgi:uncharacterized membrane protein YesL